MNSASPTADPSPRPPPWRLDHSLLPALLGLAIVFLAAETTSLDFRVQDTLFNPATGAWLVDKQAPGLRALFYTGPKIVLIILGLVALVLALGHARWRRLAPGWAHDRRGLLVVFLNLALVPLAIGQLKAATHIHCPAQLRRYGGDAPYRRVLECNTSTDTSETRGRCWPAGHASGGFALCALAGLARTRRGQKVALAIATAAGSTMGFYQMAKGDHFLSHTLITACLAWIGFLLLRRIPFLRPVPPPAPHR